MKRMTTLLYWNEVDYLYYDYQDQDEFFVVPKVINHPISVTKFRHFGGILKYLAIFEGLFRIAQNFNLLWKHFFATGQSFLAVNGQTFDK